MSLQTNHAETQRRALSVAGLWRALAQERPRGGRRGVPAGSWFSATFGWMARDYLRLATALAPGTAAVDAAVAAAAGDPRRTRRIRRLVRVASRRSLLFQKALGANPKTLLIAASMALGSLLAPISTVFGLAPSAFWNLSDLRDAARQPADAPGPARVAGCRGHRRIDRGGAGRQRSPEPQVHRAPSS